MQNTISFIVPAYNSEQTLAATVDSIYHQEYDEDINIETIIVDDGSSDNTLRVAYELRDKYPNCSVIHKENGGEASALNVGIGQAKGEFISVVESDVILEREWLKKLLKEFSEETILGVGGALITSKEDPWISRLAGYEVEARFEKKTRFTAHITSANAIYKREVFSYFGGFNENLRNSCLDADLNLKIVNNGYKLIYLKDAIAYHLYKTNFRDYIMRQYAYARFRPHLKGLTLYKEDRLLIIEFILTSGLILSVFPSIFINWIFIWIFLMAVLSTRIPLTIRLILRKRDWIIILLPFVLVLRNIVALLGYTVGVMNKIRGKY